MRILSAVLGAGVAAALAGCGGAYTAPVETTVLEPLLSLDLDTGALHSVPDDIRPAANRLVFRRIPAGVRQVSGADAVDESGPVVVALNDATADGATWLCIHEVSQAQWGRLAALVPAEARPWTAVSPTTAAGILSSGADLPAWGVDATGCANVFASWNAAHPAATLRLPTAVEWESAARSPSGSGVYGWGDTPTAAAAAPYARVGETATSAAPAPIASLRALGGWYDLHGNVWEWVTDGSARHLRGGSWCDSLASAASGNQRAMPEDVPYALAGVRPVLVMP